MLRLILAVASLILAAGLAAAQSNPIAARKALMKANADQAKIGGAIAKGDTPFDLAKVQAIFATFMEAVEKAPALFPDNSKTGGKTEALPAIWKNKPDFEARLAKFGADAKAAQAEVQDLATFKVRWNALIRTNCTGCHEKYVQKN
ncbi:MAG: cytochrome c [Bradyrhizobiaceae bacterium]|nr:cytochrome c [Bradyrhizobiaceae bacterium]